MYVAAVHVGIYAVEGCSYFVFHPKEQPHQHFGYRKYLRQILSGAGAARCGSGTSGGTGRMTVALSCERLPRVVVKATASGKWRLRGAAGTYGILG